ncbi:MAG TPA: ATP-binding cassette domain-containing protein [Caulobacteraceae bacterium]|nr:ATP-binding cassette domain-containing protein [Caulobacteraceae bacterium]
MTHTAEPAPAQAVLRVEGVVIPPCAEPIDVSVSAGSAVAVVDPRTQAGPRLLDLIATARPPREGRMALFGRDLSQVSPAERPSLRRRLGVISRDLSLAEDLDAFDNLALAARAVGRKPRDYRKPAEELLAWTGLSAQPGAPAGELSEEGRRRLALARALINGPDLLIALEPAGALTGGPRTAILKLIADLHSAGMAILLISADESLARSGAQVVRLGSAPADVEGGA